jgi:hypothetical protein
MNNNDFFKLFDIWKSHDFALSYYFDEIFEKALDKLRADVKEKGVKLEDDDDKPKYKALFVPVGYKIENVALITALFNPNHVTFAFSGVTRKYHLRHMPDLKKQIKNYAKNIAVIDEREIVHTNQQNIQESIIQWSKEMKNSFGYSEDQIVIDLTGGTKPISIGAQNAAVSLNIPAFYLDVSYNEELLQPIPGTERLLQLQKRQILTDDSLVFVIMPFADDFNNIYQTIKTAAQKISLKCVRVDEEIYSGSVMGRIAENITKAGIIIADLSNQNPNVYYELGLAHSQNKRVVMITQNIHEVKFDLKHLRILKYDKNNLIKLEEDLKKELQAILTSEAKTT